MILRPIALALLLSGASAQNALRSSVEAETPTAHRQLEGARAFILKDFSCGLFDGNKAFVLTSETININTNSETGECMVLPRLTFRMPLC